jgi:hypothetical protein
MTVHIIPRIEIGMDWGARRRLIAGVGTPEKPHRKPALFIVPGHSMGMGAHGFGQTYIPAHLVLLTDDGSVIGRRLAEGRISRRHLLDNATLINAAFGQDIASKLDLRSTTWVKP